MTSVRAQLQQMVCCQTSLAYRPYRQPTLNRANVEESPAETRYVVSAEPLAPRISQMSAIVLVADCQIGIRFIRSVSATGREQRLAMFAESRGWKIRYR